MIKPLRHRLSACDCKALLALREHDLDRLWTEHEAFLIFVDFLLSAGRLDAAREAIRERIT